MMNTITTRSKETNLHNVHKMAKTKCCFKVADYGMIHTNDIWVVKINLHTNKTYAITNMYFSLHTVRCMLPRHLDEHSKRVV